LATPRTSTQKASYSYVPAGSYASRVASSKRLEPSRKSLNLSPKPVPKKVIFDHRAADQKTFQALLRRRLVRHSASPLRVVL
jgi:hypothetical protein